MASSAALVEEAGARATSPRACAAGGQRYGMRPAPDDVSEVRPHLYPMIEDQRGVRDVAEIAAVKGISGLHIGPVDLGLVSASIDEDRFADALQSIMTSGHAVGLPVTMHAVRRIKAPDGGPGLRWPCSRPTSSAAAPHLRL